MKRFLFLIISFFVLQFVSGQAIEPVANDNSYHSSAIEVKPEFPGGIAKFYQFIGDNFKTPTAVDFLGGKIYVSFIIEKEGSLVEINVIRDVGFGTKNEAIRVLELCPKWIPGEKNGQKVRCSYSLPIVLQAHLFNTAEVEVKPEFPGGIEKFYQFIGKNFKIPENVKLNGKIYLKFVIEKDGSLNEIKVLRDIGNGTGQEAIRVLKISPNWIPGKQNGQEVRCTYSLPISIQSS